MHYSFNTPSQIIFGWGRRAEITSLLAGQARRVFLVSGSRTLEAKGEIEALREGLHTAGFETHVFLAPSREPLVSDVDGLARLWRDLHPDGHDVVLAIGGGSTLDLAKAAAALTTNTASSTVKDYLEGVGTGLKLSRPPLPLMAVPTTAGTGSEATKNAVISHLDPPFKKSLRHDSLIPRWVVIDPELTVSLPRAVTLHTGLDAFTQLVESYLSRRRAPIPQALSRQGVMTCWECLPRVLADPDDRLGREGMAHAALLSGMALANAGLGVAHAVAAALGVIAQVPHGLACAVMLPTALRLNRAVCVTALAEMARWLNLGGDDEQEQADRFIEEVTQRCHEWGVPRRLREVGVTQEQLPLLVSGSHGNSLAGNPRDVSDEELATTLEMLW